MTDVILEWTLTSVSARFPRAFKTATLLFSIQFGYRRGVFELILKYFSGVELFVCVLFDQLFEMIGQRRPGSACSRKSSLTRVYKNCLSIATCTSLSRKASECKSLRRCRHCERVHVCGDGGEAIIQN